METGDWLVFDDNGNYRVATSTTFNGFEAHPIHRFITKPYW